jgi:hypothetical protein
MEVEEIRLYLDVSIAHSVVVDVEETAGAPGTLRTIRFHQGLRVTIEFERCIDYVERSIEGGGLKYVAQHEDLATIIADIEEYLDRPVSAWTVRAGWHSLAPHRALWAVQTGPPAR